MSLKETLTAIVKPWYTKIEPHMASWPMWLKHGLAGAVIPTAVFWALRPMCGIEVSAAVAAGVTALLGWLKEVVDALTGLGTPDLAPALVTGGAGIAVSAAWGVLIYAQ